MQHTRLMKCGTADSIFFVFSINFSKWVSNCCCGSSACDCLVSSFQCSSSLPWNLISFCIRSIPYVFSAKACYFTKSFAENLFVQRKAQVIETEIESLFCCDDYPIAVNLAGMRIFFCFLFFSFSTFLLATFRCFAQRS